MTTPINQLYASIDEQLRGLGFSYQKPAGLSKSILEASRYFISNAGPSPWENKNFQAAYIAHFLPMNTLRWLKLFERMEKSDLNFGKNFLDFGAGPLTFKIAYHLKYPDKDISYSYVEKDDLPVYLGEKILSSIYKHTGRTGVQSKKENQLEITDKQGITLVLSYSLNELDSVPSAIWDFDQILILEPSNQQTSRSLIELRAKAIEKGFSPKAPCLHAEQCPMLAHSKKDWCFDRAHIQLPDLTKPLYKNLPFKTNYLTFSYLYLTKEDLKKNIRKFRAVGDWQKEKGKEKIQICRSSSKEFISNLKKNKKAFKKLTDFGRGDLKDFSFDYEIKGNELRISKEKQKG